VGLRQELEDREDVHRVVDRAVEGVERPVFQRGQQVGTIREYSDRLLMFMLKARRPTGLPGERERPALRRSRGPNHARGPDSLERSRRIMEILAEAGALPQSR
jgi:hypothetical protein